jgi:hypothetical protein
MPRYTIAITAEQAKHHRVTHASTTAGPAVLRGLLRLDPD